MWVVERLLDQGELFTLRLIQTALDTVRLLELFERQDQQLGIVLEVERREGNRLETPAFKPVYGRRVNRHSRLGGDVWAVLEVRILALLLGLEVQTRQTTQVLAAYRLIDRGTAANALTVVVGH